MSSVEILLVRRPWQRPWGRRRGTREVLPFVTPRKRGSRACPWREQGGIAEIIAALDSRFPGNDGGR